MGGSELNSPLPLSLRRTSLPRLQKRRGQGLREYLHVCAVLYILALRQSLSPSSYDLSLLCFRMLSRSPIFHLKNLWGSFQSFTPPSLGLEPCQSFPAFLKTFPQWSVKKNQPFLMLSFPPFLPILPKPKRWACLWLMCAHLQDCSWLHTIPQISLGTTD